VNIAAGPVTPRINNPSNNPGNFFAGSIDNVRVYSGALSGAQVRGLYEQDAPRYAQR
jgi:hypothetical protein